MNPNVQLVGAYLHWAADAKKQSPRTVYDRRQELAAWLTFLQARGVSSVLVASIADCAAFVGRPRTPRRGTEAAASTIRGDISTLRSFYRWARLMDHPVRVGDEKLADLMPKLPVRKPRPIVVGAWELVWFHPEVPDELRVALGLGYFTSMRRAEICALRPEQFSARPGWITHAWRKGNKRQDIPLMSALEYHVENLPHLIGDPQTMFLDPLQRTLERRPTPLTIFGEWRHHSLLWSQGTAVPPAMGVNADTYSRRLRKMLRKLGLPQDIQFTSHQARHSFVTNHLRSGMKPELVATLAGHSDIKTTMLYREVDNNPYEDDARLAVDAAVEPIVLPKFNRHHVE